MTTSNVPPSNVPTKQFECSVCLETDLVLNEKDQLIQCPHCPLRFCQVCFQQTLLQLKTPEIKVCVCQDAYSLYEVRDRVGSSWFHGTFSEHYKSVLLAYHQNRARIYQSSRLFKLYQQLASLKLTMREFELDSQASIAQDNRIQEAKLTLIKIQKKKVVAERELLSLSDPQEVEACRLRIKEIKKGLAESNQSLKDLEEQIEQEILATYDHEFNVLSSQKWRLKRLIRSLVTEETEETNLGSEEKNELDPKDYYYCPRAQCNGLVSTEEGTCDKCRSSTCLKCHELVGTDIDSESARHEHQCNPDILKNLESFKTDEATKLCPRCQIPIHKYVGCNDVFCTKCHFKFNFRTGKEIRGAFHNPEYDQYLAQVPDGGCLANLRRYADIANIEDMVSRATPPSLRSLETFVPDITLVRDQLLDKLNLSYHETKMYFDYYQNQLTESEYTHQLLSRVREQNRDRQVIDYLNTALTIGEYYAFKVVDLLVSNEVPLTVDIEVESHPISQYEDEIFSYFQDFCEQIRKLNIRLYSLGRIGTCSLLITLRPTILLGSETNWTLMKVPYTVRPIVKPEILDDRDSSINYRCALIQHQRNLSNKLADSYQDLEVLISRLVNAAEFFGFCSRKILGTLNYLLDPVISHLAEIVIVSGIRPYNLDSFIQDRINFENGRPDPKHKAQVDQFMKELRKNLRSSRNSPHWNYYIEGAAKLDYGVI